MEKENLLLLYGAIGSNNQFNSLLGQLSDLVTPHIFNFNGHGGKPFQEGGFSMIGFAHEVIDEMNNRNIENASIFGYSMGGYVGILLASLFPNRINSLITLATKFNWDEQIAEKETKLLDRESIQQKLPAFSEELRLRHAPNDWKEVLKKTAVMLNEMGSDNPLKREMLNKLNQPVLLMVGDRDKMVGLEETIDIYRSIPNAKLSILPGTPHPLEKVDSARLVYEITGFLRSC